MFESHINVEYCNSVTSIKYICKDINKGSDMAVIQRESVNRNDEITMYQFGRYLSTNEAFWRIFGFQVHGRNPAIQHLQVHLENGQRVYFRPERAHEVAQNPPATTLTGFFNLCRDDPDARGLLYQDVPRHYVWNKVRKVWTRRQRGTAIGRMYAVHPNNGECFYLRILLSKIRGPVSLQHLKTVGGTVCETFREACLRRGYLDDDRQWQNALEEAKETRSSAAIRSLFAIIVCECSPA